MAKKEKSLTEMSAEELQDKITSAKTELQRLKFTHAVTPIPNPNLIKEGRKEIARLMTALRTKELNNA